MTQASFWDGVAERYSRDKIADPDAYEYTLERTKSYLSERDKVLELGAGTSSTALRLAPVVDRYLATDGSSEMVRIGLEKLAKEGGVGNLEIDTGSFSTPAFVGAGFNRVLAFNVLHLVPDISVALRQVHAMLGEDGVFISKTPCLGSNPSLMKRVLFRTMVPAMQLVGKAPRPVHFLKVESLDALVEAAGFELVETGNFPVKVPSRFLVARKV